MKQKVFYVYYLIVEFDTGKTKSTPSGEVFVQFSQQKIISKLAIGLYK